MRIGHMDKKIKNVLFICFGNTARSPAAEGIAKALKRDKYPDELTDVHFDSAGFFNVYKVAQEETIDYVKENWNFDLNDHKGKKMDEELLKKQDLILAMQPRHLKRLKRKFKSLEGVHEKAHLLLEYAEVPGDANIDDPVNLDREQYYELMEQVEKGVIKSIEKIIKINNN
jgi:protein-tyrosine-phosphatase